MNRVNLMRLTLALIVAFIVAACALEQSRSGGGFLQGDGARSTQAALDAEVILQGMTQARDSRQRVARDVHQDNPGAAPPPVVIR
ncbi:MAG TPA: hypothetical protein VND19_25315 [Acetobacteraceae bacterium]|nr:hypothetical protein [Acetobacteraceae bacterium]